MSLPVAPVRRFRIRNVVSLPLIAGAAVVGSAALSLAGWPVWIVLVVSAVPWALILRNRLGTVPGLCAAWVGGLALALVEMAGTSIATAPMLFTFVVVSALIGITGCWRWFVEGSLYPPSRIGRAMILPALFGPALWLGASGVVFGTNPYSGLSWAMHGDAATYILYGRAATNSSGIVFGPDQNPVPLPSALLAVFMAPGRSGIAPKDLLRHDVLALEILEVLIIAVSCGFAGILAGRLARAATSSPMVVGVTSAAGSLLPLSWTVTTAGLDNGYLDALLAFPTVLAGIGIAVASRRHALASLGILALSGTILLAVWSPLVVVPGGLIAVILFAERATVRRARGRALLFLVFCVAQLLAYGLAVELPSLLRLAKLLSSSGAVHQFTPSLFPSLAFVVIVLALLIGLTADWRTAATVIVVPLALAAGLGVLLFQSRRLADPWTYFPSKFAWLSIGILLVVMMGTLPVLFASRSSRFSFRIIASVSALAMAAVLLIAAPVAGEDQSGLLTWIDQGRNSEDGGAVTARIILGSVDPSHPVIYWQSSLRSERYINYWLIEIASKSVDNNALRKFAFHYSESGTADLCTILSKLGANATVRTSNPSLRMKMQSACPSIRARFVLLAGAAA